MTKDILYDFKSLICTDPDCLQFAKKENDHSWCYIQIIHHNILDEYERHEEDFITAYENGAIVNGIDIRHAVNTYSKVSASIDLDDYKESEIERCINTFGYTIGRGRNFIDLNREEFKEDKVMLCCESLFEDMLPELLTNEQIKLLY
jgi:hypothetical protein